MELKIISYSSLVDEIIKKDTKTKKEIILIQKYNRDHEKKIIMIPFHLL